MSSPINLDLDACRLRQARLLEVIRARNLSGVLLTQQENVQWLTGLHLPWLISTGAFLAADGRLTVAVPRKASMDLAADTVVAFDAKWHSTLRNDQMDAVCEALSASVDFAAVQGLGVEFSRAAARLTSRRADLEDIEPDLYRLRRRKDPDELRLMRRAIEATGKMYERAREMIRPGICEIEVFNELQAVAVEHFGEPTTRTGNDYQCGSRGGPPRAARAANAGELYILDLGPAYRGYFADNARTIAVTQADTAQQEAWAAIQEVFRFVEETVRPGVRAQQVFHSVQEILDQAPVGKFNHHLGHGVGLFPHEAPHLNPHWDDVFEVGDVFTAEPGLYAPELRGGMRLENDYLVTEDGVECLTPFPLEL